MRLRDPGTGRVPEAGMLPMINIIFLLLVFVILTGSAGPEGEDRGAPLVALVGPAGELSVAGSALSPEQLAARLQAAQARLELRGHAALPARKLLEVLQGLQAAGVREAGLRLADP